jgi:hypothetical protein
MHLWENLNGLKYKVENLAGWFQNDFNRIKEDDILSVMTILSLKAMFLINLLMP